MTQNEGTPHVRASRLERLVVRLACWWFGCQPDYNHPCELSPNYVVPCKRCGALDTTYEDRVGVTRHNRLMRWLRYWFFRRWWPERCIDCGKRFGRHDECVPF